MSKTVVVREICFWKRVQSMEKFSYRHWRHQKQIWRPEKVPWCFLKCVVYDNELEFQKPESVISKKWFAILFLKTCPDQKVFLPVAPSKKNMTFWKSTVVYFEIRSLTSKNIKRKSGSRNIFLETFRDRNIFPPIAHLKTNVTHLQT